MSSPSVVDSNDKMNYDNSNGTLGTASISDGSHSPRPDQDDYYGMLNDVSSTPTGRQKKLLSSSRVEDQPKPSKKAGQKIRRRPISRRGSLNRFSDSDDLSEASTIDSQGKMKQIERKRKLMKSQKRVDEVSLDEDDDLVDTDKDLAGLTGLATPKSMSDRSKSLVSSTSQNEALNSQDRRQDRRRASISPHEGEVSTKRKIRRKKSAEYNKIERRHSNDNSTKARSNRRRRKETNDTCSSSDEEIEGKAQSKRSSSAGRRSSSKSKGSRRSSSDGGGKRKGRKSRSRSSGEDASVPDKVIQAVSDNLISPCTFTSATLSPSRGSTRDRLLTPSLTSPGLSRRTVESGISGLTLSPDFSSVSKTSFKDDFSNHYTSEESSRDSLLAELQRFKSGRRLPKGLLKSMNTPIMKDKRERLNNSGDFDATPSMPERHDEESTEESSPPSTPKRSRPTTLRGFFPGKSRFSEFLVKQQSSSSLTDPNSHGRPTHLFQKALSDRFLATPSTPLPENERMRMQDFLRKRNGDEEKDGEKQSKEDFSQLRSRLDGIKMTS